MSDSKEKQFALRLPTDIYQEIEGWARDELRSANQQIVAILRDAVNERRRALRAREAAEKMGRSDNDDIGKSDYNPPNTQNPGRAAQLEPALV